MVSFVTQSSASKVPFQHVEYCMGTAFVFQGRAAANHQDRLADLISDACSELNQADQIFSLYKPDSPLSRLARGETSVAELDPIVNEIWDACLEWESATGGWFSSFTPQNTFDPSGLVKTWAAQRAANILLDGGITDFTLNAGGDILINTGCSEGVDWRIAVHKPTSISSDDAGILTVFDFWNTEFRALATSGISERGNHIWNPKAAGKEAADSIVQVSVLSDDLVAADVWATAAFAEGPSALDRIEQVRNLEALMVLHDGNLIGTSGITNLLAK